jgi:hypothetical protein
LHFEYAGNSLGRRSELLVHRIVARKYDLKETTVRTLLRRLEQKGYEHEAEGRAYLYRAAEPPGHLAARAVRQIIDRFCVGSLARSSTARDVDRRRCPRELRVRAAAVRHRVSTVVMIAMLVLPLSSTWAPDVSLPVLPPVYATAPRTVDTPPLDSVGATVAAVEPATSAAVEPATAAVELAPAPSWNWRAWLLAVYFAGAAVLLTRLGIGTVRRRIPATRKPGSRRPCSRTPC